MKRLALINVTDFRIISIMMFFSGFTARLEQINTSSGVGHLFESIIPSLSHKGNIAPSKEDTKGNVYLCLIVNVNLSKAFLDTQH